MTLISPALLEAMGVSRKISQVVAPMLELGRVVPGDSFKTITSLKGVAMLVSQLAHESLLFKATSEGLNYSIAALREGNRRLHFTPSQALLYGRMETVKGEIVRPANQRAIANLYYGDRLGNRGVDTDDGWVFRGAGWLQLTGRENFTKFGYTLGMPAETAAEYARTPEGATKSAFWYWRDRGLLIPASRGDVVTCTKIIQGADAGLLHRTTLYNAALHALRSL